MSRTASSSFCPYAALGLARNCSQKEIKKAYFKKVFELHPDRRAAASFKHGRPTSSTQSRTKASASRSASASTSTSSEDEAFLRVVKAYEILSNENSRRLYDYEAASVRGGYGTGPSSHWDPTSPASSEDGSFKEFLRKKRRQAAGTDPLGFSADDDMFDNYAEAVRNNKGPRFMSNGLMAVLVAVGAVSLGLLGMLARQAWWAAVVDDDRRQTRLQRFYQETVQRGRDFGPEMQLASLRIKAQEMEEARLRQPATSIEQQPDSVQQEYVDAHVDETVTASQ